MLYLCNAKKAGRICLEFQHPVMKMLTSLVCIYICIIAVMGPLGRGEEGKRSLNRAMLLMLMSSLYFLMLFIEGKLRKKWPISLLSSTKAGTC